MRSRFREWRAPALFLASWAFLAMAVALAKKPVDPSVLCVVVSFWLLLSTCAVALLRLVASKKRDEEN